MPTRDLVSAVIGTALEDRMEEQTVGEIARSLARLEKSQEAQTLKLDAIQVQTTKTNGYVGEHERRLNVLEAAKSAPAQVVTADGESLSVKISPKMWASIVAGVTALSMAAPKVLELIEKLFAGK